MKVLDNDDGLLGNVVRMESEVFGQRPSSLLPLDIRIVLAGFQQSEVGCICDVVLKHIENKAFFVSLAHRVRVKRFAGAAEYLQRLVLRRGSKGEKAQIRLMTALGHTAVQFFHLLN